MSVLHIDSPSCIKSGVPHMWVTAKVIFCAPFLVVVCLMRSGCERNDPITTYKKLVEILNTQPNTTPSTQKIFKTNSPPSHPFLLTPPKCTFFLKFESSQSILLLYFRVGMLRSIQFYLIFLRNYQS